MDYNNYNYYQTQEKKEGKLGFAPGLGFGILIGAGAVLIAGVLIILLYTRFTSGHIVLGENGPKNIELTEVIDEKTINKIDEITEYMDIYYYDGYEKEDIQDALYQGLVSGLDDPYSVYYTAEEYAEMQIDTSGEYYGIGAGLTQDVRTMEVTITKVYEGTPAEEAGLKKNDVILYVEDIDATSMEVSDLVQHIRGEEGTNVYLKIYRPSTEEILEFEVPRRNVQLPSVTGEMLANQMGYISISEFQTNTAEQFEEILLQLESQGMKGLIVDVRANPGGLVTAVTDILDILLPEGVVLTIEDKYGDAEEYYSDSECVDYPIVVLMDENSASASEIFAGAIKDYDYGTLVGKTTYGKGIVQSIFRLNDGDALKLTTAKYFTPSGADIHGAGIEPDIEVEYEYTGPEDLDYDMQYDSQVQKAIEIMAEELAE